MSTHLIIPDTQVKPDAPLDHLDWIGRFIVEKKADTVIHLGDHWDFESLSTYDRGKLSMEGRRYSEDVKAGNVAMKMLTKPLDQYNYGRRRRGQEEYLPRLVLLRGNHEHRLMRAIEENGHLEGAIGYDDLLSPGWEVHDFLKPVFIDGIGYAHFWANPMTGRPYGGMMQTRLKTIGHSFTMGHQQTLEVGARYILGPDGSRQQRGLVAGSCYLHDESYKGHQGNAHWRGILVKHEVHDGAYDLMEVSLDYLCRKYEGVSIGEYLRATYPDQTGALWNTDDRSNA